MDLLGYIQGRLCSKSDLWVDKERDEVGLGFPAFLATRDIFQHVTPIRGRDAEATLFLLKNSSVNKLPTQLVTRIPQTGGP